MIKIISPIFSITDIIQTPQPKTFLEKELIKLLTKRLKQLNIIWSPSAFRAGLFNPRLPSRLLKKLESLILVAEASGWNISNELQNEIDETIEDIETFNPVFRKRLERERKAAIRDFKKGQAISLKELKHKLDIGNA